jgi:hypothetical protein
MVLVWSVSCGMTESILYRRGHRRIRVTLYPLSSATWPGGVPEVALRPGRPHTVPMTDLNRVDTCRWTAVTWAAKSRPCPSIT